MGSATRRALRSGAYIAEFRRAETAGMPPVAVNPDCVAAVQERGTGAMIFLANGISVVVTSSYETVLAEIGWRTPTGRGAEPMETINTDALTALGKILVAEWHVGDNTCADDQTGADGSPQ